ncbi:ANTAR domain-containing protein [Streptomyces sp. SID8379]|uniref:ANTAR domain-containing protein n=1 Tax=unclassified Streptomyces TaxID=2593676 RepID=UPI000365F85C|nr:MULTISPECIES: ANTAR domain-containing protein [unclassified Streptomyces]MYW69350.1 ANTAR domain-containing protein [Streptomyces sp. SID8379]MYW69415.1 ANTAR domain-containing protein [Streptomyces sp. SID8379]
MHSDKHLHPPVPARAGDTAARDTAVPDENAVWPAQEFLAIELRSVRERLRSLHKQEQARTRVALAQGLLMGRYQLPDADAAFTLMREASQRFNIKLHQIAAALTTASAPPSATRQWFPGRGQATPPSLPGLGAGHLDPKNQGQVLSAALERVMDVAGAQFGNAQLREADVLRMEKHRAHSQAFTDYFAFVEDGTSCHRAAEAARQVTVRDVAVTEVFDDETRQVILDSGSRAAHSVPLTGGDGIVRGVISSHHARPLTGFRPAQLAELERLQYVVGGWLQWHNRTVVLDALEHVHQNASRTT